VFVVIVGFLKRFVDWWLGDIRVWWFGWQAHNGGSGGCSRANHRARYGLEAMMGIQRLEVDCQVAAGCGGRSGLIEFCRSASDLPLKRVHVDWRKVQCSLVQALEGCSIIVRWVGGSWEVQEILPETTTDLGDECINVGAARSNRGRSS